MASKDNPKIKLKTYLNQSERTDLVFLYALVGQIEEMVKQWELRGNLTTEERGNLKRSVTYMLKAGDSIIKRIDGDLASRLVKDINATEIFCLPKTNAEIKKKQAEEIERLDLIGVHKWILESLCQKAMYWCGIEKCNPRDCNPKECDLRKLFAELDIEVFDPYDKYCPYYQKRGVEKDEQATT